MTDDDRNNPIAIATGEALGALAGAGIGGPEGAVVGAVAADPLVRLAGRAWDELRGRREESVAVLIQQTADNLDEDPIVMVEQALASEQGSRLLQEALQVAASTLQRQKIDALARALAIGLDDGTKVDEESLVIRALADLEPVHVFVMDKLDERGRHGLTASAIRSAMAPDPFEDPNFRTSFDVTAALLAVLQRHGLVAETEGQRPNLLNRTLQKQQGTARSGSSPTFRLTSFGKFCFSHLEPTYGSYSTEFRKYAGRRGARPEEEASHVDDNDRGAEK